MKQTSKTSKLGLGVVTTAHVIGAIALTSIGLNASAAPRRFYDSSNLQSGPYHKDVLPDGTVTGPLAPEANGG